MNEYLRFVDYRKALSNRVDDITYLLNQLTTLRDFFHILCVNSRFQFTIEYCSTDIHLRSRWDGLCYAGQDTDHVPRLAFGFKTIRRVIKGVPEPQLIV